MDVAEAGGPAPVVPRPRPASCCVEGGATGAVWWRVAGPAAPAGQRKGGAMSIRDVVRAWRDEEYRLSLSEAERALLPAHPSGLVELTETELDAAAGGHNSAVARCTPLQVCISQEPIGCPSRLCGSFVWG
jgi:mersacidin/lichenicidin family type 2 lantibiotic